MSRILTIALICATFMLPVLADNPDVPATYREKKKDPVLETLKQRNEARRKEVRKQKSEHENDLKAKKEPVREFKADLSHVPIPESPDVFETAGYIEPVAQYLTGTCWSFSTTSFLESEVMRLHGKRVKLSEMYTVYWEYVEKVRRWVREFGHSEIGQGSEPDAVLLIMQKYGAVPLSAYPGVPGDEPEHNHALLFKEIRSYLDYIKQHDLWDEDVVLAHVRRILDRQLGAPPTTFTYQGAEYTPEQFLANALKLNLDDYVAFCSFRYAPYWTTCTFNVPDNWRQTDTWHNVPLHVFTDVLKQAIQNGYTASIGGDVSEAGYVGKLDAAIVPDFDIPVSAITPEAREFRFANQTTTDDHLIHIVGHTEVNGDTWYLVKDSARAARKGRFEGYLFYREDYVKLKMLVYLLHRDAVDPALLQRFDGENR